MLIDLTGKRALVCGSSQGIGKATAIQLATMGASITLLARNRETLEVLQRELPTSANQKHDVLVADFSQPEQLKDTIEAYVQGGNQIQILVNNTGGPAGGEILADSTQKFIDTFQQHVICNHILAQAIVPGMKQSNYGRIINIISTSVKAPLPNLGVSNTIRGAVANWAKTLANELGKYGITVNNVLPGATATQRLASIISNKSTKVGASEDEVSEEMKREIPLQRFAQPEEIAYAVAFLASPSAAYINGINLPVDGGRTASL